MEAIVLAGGLGTRLRAVVPNLPKPMAPIAGRPFLEIVLVALAENGFRRIVLSLGYMADSVVGYFGDSFEGMRLVHEIERTPLGTGGALRQALRRCEINAGCYVFPKAIDRDFPGDAAFSLEADFLQGAVTRMPIHFFVSSGDFIDIGVPDDYERAQSQLAKVCR